MDQTEQQGNYTPQHTCTSRRVWQGRRWTGRTVQALRVGFCRVSHRTFCTPRPFAPISQLSPRLSLHPLPSQNADPHSSCFGTASQPFERGDCCATPGSTLCPQAVSPAPGPLHGAAGSSSLPSGGAPVRQAACTQKGWMPSTTTVVVPFTTPPPKVTLRRVKH